MLRREARIASFMVIFINVLDKRTVKDEKVAIN